jgi:hypothetical protein
MANSPTPIIHVRDLREPHESRRALARGALRGDQIRVARGAYVELNSLAPLSARERYLLHVRAVAESRRSRPVVSHWSAAAIHNLPILGRWPDAVHLTIGPTSGGRSRGGVVKHSAALENCDVIEINGMWVTSIARTVIDMAAALPFLGAVMIVDRALLVDRFGRIQPMTDRVSLEACWESMGSFRGFARAKSAIDFGEHQAESPLESVSRVSMRVIGCPRPILQAPHSDAEGHIGETDFYWPEFNAVGEADGKSKYIDPALRGGRSAEEVVVDEKWREDRLRALPRAVARWGWDVGINPARLRLRLQRLGLPTGLHW